MTELFWISDDAEKYEAVASNWLTTDIPPYLLCMDLLTKRTSGGALLDVGCFQGDSSVRLFAGGGGRFKILGCDINPELIETARTRWNIANSAVEFQLLDPSLTIPLPREINGYEGALMTFVHPTIGDKQELQLLLMQVATALKPGSPLVMLGLHPNSFNLTYTGKFLNYAHRLPEGGEYIDGKRFPNTLKSNGKIFVEFEDVCWTEDTIRSFLLTAGFSNVNVFGLSYDMQPIAGMQLSFGNYVDIASMTTGFYLGERIEYKAPLYQVFIAYK